MGCGGSKDKKVETPSRFEGQQGLQNKDSNDQKEVEPPLEEKDVVTVQNEAPANQTLEHSVHIESPLRSSPSPVQVHVRNTNKDEYTEADIRILGDRIKLPTMLYYFDFQRGLFHFFEPETGFWRSSDIAEAETDCPKNPLMFFRPEVGKRAQAEEQLSNMSLTLTDRGTVFIIGGFHPLYSNLEYNVKENRFAQKHRMLKNCNNPNLCYMDRFVYSISGDEIDDYSYRFDRFDIEINEWTELPPLLHPHGFGSALCIITDGNRQNATGGRSAVKVIVGGGLAQKLPRTYNRNFSIFDFYTMQWTEIPIEDMMPRVPRFVRSPMIQDERGKIHILGAEGTGECYMLDLASKKMSTKGKLARGDDPEKAGFCNDAIMHENFVQFIYKRENLRESRGMLRFHRGQLEHNHWELV